LLQQSARSRTVIPLEDGACQAQRPVAGIDGGEGSLIQINGFGLDYGVNVAGQTRIRE
jgi:hypothetical protein